MATAVLVPCGVRLRSDFNALAPDRDKDSDGWIGDTAHQQETSDHNPDETGSVPIHDADKVNEVHAVDVDVDLRESDLTMERVVQFLLGRCHSGAEKRLRYIIYNRRIWEASNGWKQRAYTGPSPHTEHAHFSFSYDTAREADKSTWHLEDIPVALTEADKTWIEERLDQRAKEDYEDLTGILGKLTETVVFAQGGGQHSAVGDAVLNSSYPAEENAQRTLVWVNLQRIQSDLTVIKDKLVGK